MKNLVSLALVSFIAVSVMANQKKLNLEVENEKLRSKLSNCLNNSNEVIVEQDTKIIVRLFIDKLGTVKVLIINSKDQLVKDYIVKKLHKKTVRLNQTTQREGIYILPIKIEKTNLL